MLAAEHRLAEQQQAAQDAKQRMHEAKQAFFACRKLNVSRPPCWEAGVGDGAHSRAPRAPMLHCGAFL